MFKIKFIKIKMILTNKNQQNKKLYFKKKQI